MSANIASRTTPIVSATILTNSVCHSFAGLTVAGVIDGPEVFGIVLEAMCYARIGTRGKLFGLPGDPGGFFAGGFAGAVGEALA